MRRKLAESWQNEKPSDESRLEEGVNSIMQSLESGSVQGAMDTRSELLELFKVEDFASVEGYEETVVQAHRKAAYAGDTKIAARIRRNFGQGLDFPRYTKESVDDDDPVDSDVREARELMRETRNSPDSILDKR